MTLPQHVTYQVGGQVSIALRTQAQNALVTLEKRDGTDIFTGQSATVSTINTALNAAASKGAYSISVSSATGISNGSTFWIQDVPEQVLAESVSGGTVTLRQPLLNDHADAATVDGTQLTYDVNAGSANSLWWDGRVLWNVDANAIHYTAVECTRYPLDRLATTAQLGDEQPKLFYITDRETDWERYLDRGHEEVLKRLAKAAPDLRARVWPGSSEFQQATVYATFMLYYGRHSSEKARVLFEHYDNMLTREVESICAVVPRDADQDGVVEEDEKINPRTIRLQRA